MARRGQWGMRRMREVLARAALDIGAFPRVYGPNSTARGGVPGKPDPPGAVTWRFLTHDLRS